MNLGLCIVNLLRRYPAVEVPGLGVFKVTHMPASYDRERSVLLPPTSRVELAEEHNDFFPILNYLQTQVDVDESTAAQMLDRAVGEVFDAVNRNGRALLDGLGYLMPEGASFVLKPFDTRGLEIHSVKVTPEETTVSSPVVSRPELADEVEESDKGQETVKQEALPVVEESTVPSRRYHPIRWIVAAALILLVSAAGVVTWHYRSDWFGGEKKAPFSTQKDKTDESPDQSQPSGRLASPVDTIADSTAVAQLGGAAADSVHADATVAVTEPVKPAVTYEIIVGSFATMAQAEKYVATMKAKGYNLQALDSRMPGNRKKISWGSYATEEEAYRELVRVQKNFEPGAWIAKVENE